MSDKTVEAKAPAKKGAEKVSGNGTGSHAGYSLDTYFIQHPHEYDPRRLYSQNNADWQYRVDHDRMRKERLARLQAQLKARDIGAIVVYAGANVRYATGSYQGNWKYNINIRYAVVPASGDPVLFETAGSDFHCAHIDLPWLGNNNIRPAMTWQWAEGAVPHMVHKMVGGIVDVLKENGIAKERVAIDNLDMAALRGFQEAGINIVDGWPAISGARVIKTRDEIELLKMASSIGDAAMWKIKHEWLKPGVREREIEAKVHEFMLERGCEIIYDIIVASGGNTSPYRRWATDKMIRQGDLVIVDINAVGPGGYFIDFVRNFKCAAKMTAQEIDLYKEVYDSMYAGIEMLKPGNSTWDVVKKFPKYDDDVYGTCTLQQFAHSIGLTLYEGMWMSRGYSKDFPAEIKENMYFAIETFAGHPRLRQTSRLEENVLVSKDGPVVFTLMEHMEETGCKWEPKHGIYAPVHFTADDVTVVPDDAKWNK